MAKLVNLTLTDDDCLNVRMALNATAIHWGELATAARNEGRKVDADTCERIRSDYHRLWEAVNVAQEAAPDPLPATEAATGAALREAYEAEPRKACVNTLKAHLAQGNRATRRAKAGAYRRPNAGDLCDDCGVEVEKIIGCPDGAEICQDCFDAGRH